jgi:hypothetical protein
VTWPRIAVELESPTGVLVDVSARIERGGMTQMSEEIGDDILELTHSDFDLKLDDNDGAIESFFADADPDDVYLMRVRRETLKRRPKYELLFEGILQLPWSLRFDRKSREVSLQALSYSKLLELSSADSLMRDASAHTATVTAGTATITMSPNNTPFRINDEITLSYGGLTESAVILSKSLVSGTVEVKANFTNGFAAAAVEIDTPHPRHQTIKALVESLFGVAGISNVVTVLEGVANDDARPFLQGWTNTGLLDILGGLEYRNLISMSADLVTTGPRGVTTRIDILENRSTDPGSAWSTVGAPGTTYADWTPYLTTEPSALEEVNNHWDLDVQRTGRVTVVNPVGDWNAGYDHDGGVKWSIRRVLSAAKHDLQIFKDNVYESADFHIINTIDNFENACCDFFPGADFGFTDLFVCSYQEDDSAPDTVNIKTYDGTTVRTLTSTEGGGGCRTVAEFEVIAVQDYGDATQNSLEPGTIRFYEGSASGSFLSVLKATPYKEPVMLMWTMRAIGDYLVCLYQQDGTTRCHVWRWSDLEAVDDFQVSDTTTNETYMTKHQVEDESGSMRDSLVGSVAGIGTFMLCETMLGTIPYADFDGDDVAAAMKKLAVLSNATIEVDRHKRGIFRQRGRELGDAEAVGDLGVPRDRESIPVWEFYKDSVEVTGEAADGSEVSVTVGETGRKARRIELDSALITTTSYARAIASLYLSFFSVKRHQESVSVEDLDAKHSFDKVTMDGRTWIVLEPSTDVVERSQDLTLVSEE